jgi:predicted amidophosphoribosyltransferase
MLLVSSCVVCRSIGPGICPTCVALLDPSLRWRPDGPIDGWTSLFAYEGAGRDVITRLKYANHRDAVDQLAGAMSRLTSQLGIDVVTWAPTSPVRRRRRGFDQSEMLARKVASPTSAPCRRLLRRVDGEAQTGHDRATRARVRFESVTRVVGTVLIVDDVRTTGATLRAAATAARSAGADHVLAITVADRR